MAKQSGLGDALWNGGYDIGGDINALGRIGGGNTPIDLTDITQSAHDRTGGRRDGSIEAVAFFNPATDRAHPVLSALPTTDQIFTYGRGVALGGQAACVVAKQTNYDPTRGDDGSFTFAVSALANGFGLEWGRLLTAGKRTDSGATNGSSVDFGTGSTSFGLQAYLHVFAFTGTDATIKIQESSDDGAVDAFADVTGGAFAQVTSAPGDERIATSDTQTIERYLRVVTVTTGGFSNLVFGVIVNRNDTATVF